MQPSRLWFEVPSTPSNTYPQFSSRGFESRDGQFGYSYTYKFNRAEDHAPFSQCTGYIAIEVDTFSLEIGFPINIWNEGDESGKQTSSEKEAV